MKYHISKNGESKVCRAAEGNCPLGSDSPHFTTSEDARAYFEDLMKPKESIDVRSDAEKALLKTLLLDNVDTIIAINESEIEIVVNGKKLEFIDEMSDHNISEGNSLEVAELISKFTEGEDEYDDGLIELSTISHKPISDQIGVHHANTFIRNGQQYVFDVSFSEVNPNASYPYLDTVENWRKDINRVSFIGREDYIPPPIDPRTLELPKFAHDEYNPLIERAELTPVKIRRNDEILQFLEIDNVKVAAASYKLVDGVPKLHSIETREGYKRQGYMKKLLSELAKASGVEKVLSSGSYTSQGYEFTRHLTSHREGGRPIVAFPDFTEEKPFSFVDDWIEGYAK